MYVFVDSYSSHLKPDLVGARPKSCRRFFIQTIPMVVFGVGNGHQSEEISRHADDDVEQLAVGSGVASFTQLEG